MLKIQQDVKEFHEQFRITVETYPIIATKLEQMLRVRVITEETDELLVALLNEDMVKIADGIADAIYVIIGTAVTYGIDIEPIWDEVHRTNMAKVGGGVREDGKILKPVGWEPPKIKELLDAQS